MSNSMSNGRSRCARRVGAAKRRGVRRANARMPAGLIAERHGYREQINP
jgi:hypothetical protein